MSIEVKLEMISKDKVIALINDYIMEMHHKYHQHHAFENVIYHILTELKRRIENEY